LSEALSCIGRSLDFHIRRAAFSLDGFTPDCPYFSPSCFGSAA